MAPTGDRTNRTVKFFQRKKRKQLKRVGHVSGTNLKCENLTKKKKKRQKRRTRQQYEDRIRGDISDVDGSMEVECANNESKRRNLGASYEMPRYHQKNVLLFLFGSDYLVIY